MKTFFLPLIVGLLLYLSGCAVIDTSTLDTAIPLKPGKIKVMTYAVSGVEQNSLIFSPGLPEDDDNDRVAGSKMDLGIKLGVGVGDHVELDASALAFSSPLGKLALKVNILDNGTNAISLQPAIYSYRGTGPEHFNPGGDDRNFRGKYRSNGSELPVLLTHRNTANSNVTLCAKLGYNSLHYERRDLANQLADSGDYDSFYGGLLANAKIKFWKIAIIPEGGVYAVQVHQGKFSLVPVLNLGLGFDMGE